MYKNFFGLRENPFNANPDPRFLYLTPQTQETLAELTYGIQNRKGFILLTGEVGTGKTTLINSLLDWLHQRKTPVAFIFNSHLSVNHLFEFILTDFGISLDFQSKSNMLMRLNTWLIERFRAGENPVLIVDEAQGLSFESLEEIRLLLNLETASQKLLQIVLAGQPELEDKLKRPRLRQLRQRITLRCRTAPFTLEESRGYTTERLRIGGARYPIFASDTMEAVHFYSQGIPRIINLLCEHALIRAYVEHLCVVPVRIVEEAAHEFVLDEDRQFETRRNSGAVVSSNSAVMHSIVVNGMARPFATEEANCPEPSHAISPAELGARVAIEGPALTGRNNSVTTVRQRDAISPSIEGSIAPIFLNNLIPVSFGPEVKPKESAPCLDSIACVSGSVPLLITDWKCGQVTSVVIPPLPLMGSGTEGESSSTAKSSPITLAENRTLALHTINQLSRSPRRTPIHALLFSWKSWSPHWMNGFLATISLAKWSRVSFAALRRIRQSTFLHQALLRRWKLEFILDWTAMINAIALPEMKKSFVRWLR